MRRTASIFVASILLLAAWLGAAAAGERGPRLAEPGVLRVQARAAFYQADYEAMAEAYAPLAERVAGEIDAAAGDPARLEPLARDHLEDLFGLGHAHQLAGRWREAVAAYQQALGLVELARRAGVDTAPRRSSKSLVRTHGFLVWWIGRIQREALGDLPAAAATFAKVADVAPILRRSPAELRRERVDQMRRILRGEKLPHDKELRTTLYYPRFTLQELVVTEMRRGRTTAALEALDRANLLSLIYGAGEGRGDATRAGELLRGLPEGTAPPRVAGVIALSPGRPERTLKLDDPAALAECDRTSTASRTSWWHYTFAPPPGVEFAAVDFACDIEQIEVRYGGQFSCSAHSARPAAGAVSLGSISWHNEGPPGRKVIRRRFEVPPGTEVLGAEITQSPGKFRVHSVTARATFRPRTRDARLPLKLRIQTEALPEGGELTCAGQPVHVGAAFTGLEPGLYEFAYRVPGREDVWQCRARLVPGAVYGLFANLDSPFRWQLTTLRSIGEHPPGRPSLVRTRDGRWLTAYSSGSTLKLSASKDGVTWEDAWTLPHSTLFERTEPTLHLDAQGALWLAYFCDRLRTAGAGVGGTTLWLRRSRDGRTWSRPRPIELEGRADSGRPPWRDYMGGVPCGGVHLAGGPDGRQWLFWRDRLGSGPSLDRLEPLRQYRIEGARLTNMSSPHVTIDPEGRLHMVFLDHQRGICYATSDDGQQWTAPVSLVEGVRGGYYGSVQLVLDRERAALLYSDTKGGWWRRGTLVPAPKFEPPVKVTNHVIPPCGSRACITPDGQVALLTGSDTVWLLRAPLTRLTRPDEAEF